MTCLLTAGCACGCGSLCAQVTSFVPRDIEPVTPLENFTTVLTMFVGLILNAYIISSLTAALASMNAKKELAGKQLNMIKNYLIIKSVPSDLRSRILEYFEYLFTSSAAMENMSVFAQMPPALTCQLSLSTNRKIAGARVPLIAPALPITPRADTRSVPSAHTTPHAPPPLSSRLASATPRHFTALTDRRRRVVVACLAQPDAHCSITSPTHHWSRRSRSSRHWYSCPPR